MIAAALAALLLVATPTQAASPARPPAYGPAFKGTKSAYVVLIRLRYDLYGRWKQTGKWPDDPEANRALSGHVAYWNAQLKSGRALMAGGMTGDYWDNAAMIVFEAASQKEAEGLVAQDPAVKAFVFQAQVRPFDVSWMTDKFATPR